MKITLQLINRTCGSCGHEYKYPEMRGGTYGEFLLRASSGALSYVNAIDDSVFAEISDSAKINPKTKGLQVRAISGIVHRVFSLTCDPSPDGSRYEIGRQPTCPHCGHSGRDKWIATDPPELVQMEVSLVSHDNWSKLTQSQRGTLIDLEFERLANKSGSIYV